MINIEEKETIKNYYNMDGNYVTPILNCYKLFKINDNIFKMEFETTNVSFWDIQLRKFTQENGWVYVADYKSLGLRKKGFDSMLKDTENNDDIIDKWIIQVKDYLTNLYEW